MEPKENAEAANRASEIISELHEIFNANGWPIACIAIADCGEGKLLVLGTNQLALKSQFMLLMNARAQGRALIDAAQTIDRVDDADSDSAEGVGNTLKKMLGALANAAGKVKA